jgi:hypothetical protein
MPPHPAFGHPLPRWGRGQGEGVTRRRSVFLACKQRLDCRAIALHDESVRFRNAVQWIAPFELQHKCVIQTARPLQHSAAAGTSSQNRRVAAFASSYVHFGFDLVRVSDNNEMFSRLPESQHVAACACFSRVEQCFVAGEIFCRCGQGQVQIFHYERGRAWQQPAEHGKRISWSSGTDLSKRCSRAMVEATPRRLDVAVAFGGSSRAARTPPA